MVKEIEVISETDNRKIVNIDNNKYLAFSTGMNKLRYSKVSKSLSVSKSGYRWDGHSLKEVCHKDIIEIDGIVHLYGGFIDITPLSSYLLGPLDEKLTIIKELAAMFLEMGSENISIERLSAASIYINSNKEIFILSDHMTEIIFNRSTDLDQIRLFDVHTLPDIKDNRRISFFLATLLYRSITTQLPFMDYRGDLVRDRIRSNHFIPVDQLVKGLPVGISSLINRALLTPSISLGMFLGELDDNYLSCNNTSLIVDENIEDKISRSQKRFSRKVLIKNNRLKIVTVFVLLISVSVSIFSFLNREIPKAPTLGFTKEQVINEYFNSFHDLSDMGANLNSHCVSKNVERNDADEILFKHFTYGSFILSGELKILSPKEWIESEDKRHMVYGVLDPKIVNLGDNRYRVTYEKWETKSSHEESVLDSQFFVERSILTEIFIMKKIGEVWKIDDIETLDRVIETL